MFLRPRIVENPYSKVAEMIRRDLMMIFQKKGISCSKVKIDMKQDNMNISVCIKEK